MLRRCSKALLGGVPLPLPALPALRGALGKRAAESRHVRRIAPATRPSDPPVQSVRIAGLGADLLLHGSFEAYLERLEASGIFPAEAIEGLRGIALEKSPEPDPDQPVVGIVLSGPPVFHGEDGVDQLCAEMRELGCRVVLIPPCADLLMPEDPAGRVRGMRALLSSLDGLIGPGGEDIDPAIYHQPNTHSRSPNLRRDRFEADLTLLAKSEDLFMFGICRSHQLWNAADDGELVQDLQAAKLTRMTRRQKELGIPRDQPLVIRDPSGRIIFENRVHLDPRSRMADVTRQTDFLTNAFRHQGVAKAGNDFDVVGYSEDPETGCRLIEATESWKAFTVQWHPEAMWHDPLQRRLLGSVARRAALFRAVRRLSESGGPITGEALCSWVEKRSFTLDPGDRRWVQKDLVPHLFGKAVPGWRRAFRATETVASR